MDLGYTDNQLYFKMNIAEKARLYAIECHRKKNNLYDGKPYEYHLYMVDDVIEEFIDLIEEEHMDDVRGGGWTHDTIEDCGETFNDVKKATNEEVAELAYALTNEKGKTRAERANSKYYRGIRRKPRAKFLKLADRIANVKHSKFSGKSGMFEKYQKENPKFIWGLIKPEWYEVHLWALYMLSPMNFLYFRIKNDKYSEMIIRLNELLFDKQNG